MNRNLSGIETYIPDSAEIVNFFLNLCSISQLAMSLYYQPSQTFMEDSSFLFPSLNQSAQLRPTSLFCYPLRIAISVLHWWDAIRIFIRKSAFPCITSTANAKFRSVKKTVSVKISVMQCSVHLNGKPRVHSNTASIDTIFY